MLDQEQQLAVIRGLREGRRDAWTALYDGYGSEVWRYVARLRGGHGHDVADVVQETFLAAARGARQFDPSRGSLWSWLAGIAHHQVHDDWRRQRKSDRLRDLAASGVIPASLGWSETTTTEEIWQQREQVELVRGALAALPGDYAALIAAKYLDDLSLEEMASQFGGSVEAIKSKLARARKSFRETLESLTREPSVRSAVTVPHREIRDAHA